MESHKNFDKNHKNLISKFIELCLSDKNFIRNWSFLSMDLHMDDREPSKTVQSMTVETQNFLKDIKNKFNLCIKTIVKSKIIIKPKISDDKNFIFRFLLVDLLNFYIDLIKKYDSLQLPKNEQLFFALGLQNYQGYRDYIFSKNQKFEILVFLKNFNSSQEEGKEIKLLSGITLRNVDINQFVKQEEFASFYRVNHALVFEFKTEKFGNLGSFDKSSSSYNNFIYPGEEINYKLYKILTVLRLLKDGDVGVSKIIAFNPSPFSKPFNIDVSSDFNVSYSGKEYQFIQTDVGKFKALYKKLDSFFITKQKNNEIKICVSRFNKSYMRNDATDQMIDLVIAMEAITTETKDSLRYKVSVQLARLLKKTIEDREKMKRKINKIYDKRSKLVHTGATKIDCEEELNDAKIIVKAVIIKLLQLIKKDSFENILNKITYGK